MTPDFAALNQQITAYNQEITDYLRQIHQGDLIQAQGMEQKIVQLCEHIGKLPKAQSRALLPALEKLLEQVDRLENDLDAQHGEITKHLQFQTKTVNPLFAQEIDTDPTD